MSEKQTDPNELFCSTVNILFNTLDIELPEKNSHISTVIPKVEQAIEKIKRLAKVANAAKHYLECHELPDDIPEEPFMTQDACLRLDEALKELEGGDGNDL